MCVPANAAHKVACVALGDISHGQSLYLIEQLVTELDYHLVACGNKHMISDNRYSSYKYFKPKYREYNDGIGHHIGVCRVGTLDIVINRNTVKIRNNKA